MCDQNLVISWIENAVKKFQLIPVRRTASVSAQANCSSLVYKWPLESGNGAIRFYYDLDTLMAVFSVTFKQAFDHFSLPELDGDPYAALYFDQAVSCFLDNTDTLFTPPMLIFRWTVRIGLSRSPRISST